MSAVNLSRRLWVVRITYMDEACVIERQVNAPDALTASAIAAALSREAADDVESVTVEEVPR